MQSECRARVLITGMGAVTPFGVGIEPLWKALLDGANGIRAIDRFDASDYPCRVAGLLPRGFDFREELGEEITSRTDEIQALSIIATREALRHGGLDPVDVDRSRFGVIGGAGTGHIQASWDYYLAVADGDWGKLDGSSMPRATFGAVSAWPARDQGLRGPNESVCLACASGNAAIAIATRLIREGQADRMLAGAADYFHETGLQFFSRSGAIASAENGDAIDIMRPFDRNRAGIVLADGAGYVLLESEKAARARGAKIYGEVLGFGQTADAYSMVMPRADGEPIAMAIRYALRDASIEASEVEYICAHGTGTQASDPTEVAAIKAALGDHAQRVPVSSVKSLFGHSLGASSALEVITATLASNRGVIPATPRLEDPDPLCDLDHVPGTPRPQTWRTFLNNSFGFGGQNVVLAVRGGDPEEGRP